MHEKVQKMHKRDKKMTKKCFFSHPREACPLPDWGQESIFENFYLGDLDLFGI